MWLEHGTTRLRAISLVSNGPDLYFAEGGHRSPLYSYGFWMCRKGIVEYDLESPESYARRKSANFPNEGGAVILEVEVPNEIVELSEHQWYGEGTYQFDKAKGIEELLRVWRSLEKVIRDVE